MVIEQKSYDNRSVHTPHENDVNRTCNVHVHYRNDGCICIWNDVI